MPEHEKLNTTSKGMPILTEATIGSIFDTYTKGREKWGERLEEVKARMIKEQPELVKFLESQANKYPEEIRMPILEVAVAMYAVLEQQANSDKMSSLLSVGPEKE